MALYNPDKLLSWICLQVFKLELSAGESLSRSTLLNLYVDVKYLSFSDEENETPLHLASYIGSKECVESLLGKDKTIVDSENVTGETPAMFAAINNQQETLKLLLDNNAKLYARSHDDNIEKKKTCLDWAVENRQPDTVRVILEYKDGQKWKEVRVIECS